MRHGHRVAALAAPIALLASTSLALAQAATAPADPGVKVLSEWNYQPLYAQGMRASELLDAEVYGREGTDPYEEIGSVENVLIGENNEIVAIIAQVGGFWDIGDTHVLVPWDQVTMTGEGVSVPVNEENVEDYNLYAPDSYISQAVAQQKQVVDDDLATGPSIWKLTDLVGDYAVLSDARGYGYVEDAIFSQEGSLQAVVIEPDVGSGYGTGPYAAPFYGDGWDPGMNYYTTGYGADELAELDPFDYDAIEGPWD